MKELSTETLEIMQSAVSSQTEQSLKSDFFYKRELPENLKSLEKIAWNYYWSWEKSGAEIFRELEPSLWEQCEQNPRLLLKKISQFRLWQKSLDDDYVVKLNRFAGELDNYLSQPTNDFGKIKICPLTLSDFAGRGCFVVATDNLHQGLLQNLEYESTHYQLVGLGGP